VTALPVLALIARIFCFTFSDSMYPPSIRPGVARWARAWADPLLAPRLLGKTGAYKLLQEIEYRKIVPLRLDEIMSYLYDKIVAKQRRIELIVTKRATAPTLRADFSTRAPQLGPS
jgi:hypothetical protein